MLHNGTRFLFDYWNELRAGNRAPNRVDISPVALSKILPSTFILEADEASPFCFRLAGTALCLLFGEELKNYEFTKLFDQDERKLVSRLLITASQEKTCILLQMEALSEDGRKAQLETLVTPLADDKPRLLGSMHIFDLPYWVGAEQLVSVRVTSVRIVDADRPLIALHNRPAVPFPKRIEGRKRATPRFAVLKGGAMLAGPQIRMEAKKKRSPELRIVPGGKK